MTREVRASDTCAYQTKLMFQDINFRFSDHGQYRPLSNSKSYKGKHIDLKCQYCHNLGHNADCCWLLHPKIYKGYEKIAKTCK